MRELAAMVGGSLGLVTVSAAADCALASFMPGAHGGQRDGAEHREQDGTPVA